MVLKTFKMEHETHVAFSVIVPLFLCGIRVRNWGVLPGLGF